MTVAEIIVTSLSFVMFGALIFSIFYKRDEKPEATLRTQLNICERSLKAKDEEIKALKKTVQLLSVQSETYVKIIETLRGELNK